MRLPESVTARLLAYVERWMDEHPRTPGDKNVVLIGPEHNWYIERWHWIRRNLFFNVYFHRIWRGDDDRAPHDHRGWVISFVLKKGYWEFVPYTKTAPDVGYIQRREPGDVVVRPGGRLHRIIQDMDPAKNNVQSDEPAITVFVTLMQYRIWGFQCKHRWIPHTEFLDPTNSGLVGPGCGD